VHTPTPPPTTYPPCQNLTCTPPQHIASPLLPLQHVHLKPLPPPPPHTSRPSYPVTPSPRPSPPPHTHTPCQDLTCQDLCHVCCAAACVRDVLLTYRRAPRTQQREGGHITNGVHTLHTGLHIHIVFTHTRTHMQQQGQAARQAASAAGQASRQLLLFTVRVQHALTRPLLLPACCPVCLPDQASGLSPQKLNPRVAVHGGSSARLSAAAAAACVGAVCLLTCGGRADTLTQ